MALRARFPGRPSKNSDSRTRVASFTEPTPTFATPSTSTKEFNSASKKKLDTADYAKIASQTATNLKAFRMLFGTSEEEDEVLVGFKPNGKLAKLNKKKKTDILIERKTLEAQLREIEQKKNKTKPILKKKLLPTPIPTPSQLQRPVSEEDEEKFPGFGVNDPRINALKKRRKILTEEILVLSESESSLESKKVSKLTDGVYRNLVKNSSNLNENESCHLNGAETSSSINNIRRRVENRKAYPNDLTSTSTESESDNPLCQDRGKVIAQSTVNNHRVKQLRFLKYTATENGNSGGTSLLGRQDSNVPKGFQTDQKKLGLLKFNEGNEDRSEYVIFTDNEDCIETNNLNGANGEILLDRQGRRIRRKWQRQKRMIRPFGVVLSNDIMEKDGFPVIIDRSLGVLPPKTLCFLCGSAGIEQLIFCSSCCEPYHPYCSDDSSLFNLFISKSVQTSRTYQDFSEDTDELVKTPKEIRVYYTDNSNPSCVKNLSSILSPPLTPKIRIPGKLENHLLKERQKELVQLLKKWTCNRCTSCKACGFQQKKDCNEGSKNEFLRCWNCRSAFHIGCISKKVMNKEKWECSDCFKCGSCQKKIDGKTFEVNCTSTLEVEKHESSSRNLKLLFCRDCMKKRQRGSFCPLCNCCYDDDDYDTRMMECASCKKWAHATCENLTEECYQILSSLPESVEYICRLCDNTGKSNWRKAISIELVTGCETVLAIFQKKALTTSRKVQSPLKRNSPGSFDKEAGGLLTDLKMHVSPSNLINIPETLGKPNNNELDSASTTKNVNEMTPVKNKPSSHNGNLENGAKYIFSPAKCITNFMDSYMNTTFQEKNFSSVLEFNETATEFISQTFVNSSEEVRIFQNHFDSSLKEIFPWFNAEEIKKSELTSALRTRLMSNISSETKTLSDIQSTNYEHPLPSTDLSTGDEIDPFQDMYWSDIEKKDSRQCSFCHGFGDSDPDFCGRLLYAGLSDWVHVNCALWSSEVWEDENGALQQVGVALSRSKNLTCEICKKFGASVGCCHGTCPYSFHFPCALNSNCYLMENKSLFCSLHTKKAKGEIQQDMQVMRQVFIDNEWIQRKEKEKLACSSNLTVIIGSLCINSLGQILPLSAFEDPSESVLIPIEFNCTRVFWSYEQLNKKDRYTFSTGICANQPEEFTQLAANMTSLVVDHSKGPEIVKRDLCQARNFCHWVDTCPIYIDENNERWFPPCPFLDKNEDDDDGNEADIEDNIGREDVEVQTSFSSCSTRGSSLEASPQHSLDDEAELLILTDCLTPDAVQQLYEDDIDNFCVDDIWEQGDLQHVNCNFGIMESNELLRKEDKKIPFELLQVDGAVNFSSDSEEDSGSFRSPKSKKRKRGSESPVRRGRSAAAKNDSNAGGRILRSREKVPQNKKRKEEFKCPHCKKAFVSNVSVSRHSTWCKSKPNLQKLDLQAELKKKQEKILSLSNQEQPTTSKSARESMLARTVRKQAVLTPKDGGKESDSTDESSSEENKECSDTTENTPLMITEDKQQEDSNNEPTIARLTCPKCHNTYRTEESLKKHLGSCTALSSSGEESFEEPEVSNVQVVQNVVTEIAEQKDSTSEAESESLSQGSVDCETAQQLAEDTEAGANLMEENTTSFELENPAAMVSENTSSSILADSLNVENEIPVHQGSSFNVKEERSTPGVEEVQVLTSQAEHHLVQEIEAQPQSVMSSDQNISSMPLMHNINPPQSDIRVVKESPPKIVEYVNVIDNQQQINQSSFEKRQQFLTENLQLGSMNNPQQQPVISLNQNQFENVSIQPPQLPFHPIPIVKDNNNSSLPVVYGNNQKQSFYSPNTGNSNINYSFINKQQLAVQNEVQQHLQQFGPQLSNEMLPTQCFVSSAMSPNHSARNVQPQQSHESINNMDSSVMQPEFQNVLIQTAQGQLVSARVQISNHTPQNQQQIIQRPILPNSFSNQQYNRMLNTPYYQSHYQEASVPLSVPTMIQNQQQRQAISQIPQEYLTQAPAQHYQNHPYQIISQQHPPAHPVPMAHNDVPSAPLFQDRQGNMAYVIMQPGNSPFEANNSLREIPVSQFGHQSNLLQQQQQQPFRFFRNSPCILGTSTQPHNVCGIPNSAVEISPCPLFRQREEATNSQLQFNNTPRNSVNASNHLNVCSCFDCQNQISSVNRSGEKIKIICSPKKLIKSPTVTMKQVRTRAQRPNIITDKNGQRVLVSRPARMAVLPKLLPATTQLNISNVSVPPNTSLTLPKTITSNSLPNPIVASSILPGKVSASNPNIAVVRPMEHPLMSIQKMSDQIHQIQQLNRFASPTPLPSTPSTSAQIINSSMITVDHSQIVSGPEINQAQNQLTTSTSITYTVPVSTTCMIPVTTTIIPFTLTSASNSISGSVSTASLPSPAIQSAATPSESSAETNTKNTAIKMTLKRKEGEDSYSINSVSAPESQLAGKSLRHLKIKNKITSGDQAGTSADVIVEPVVHTVPIPNTSEANRTICEDPFTLWEEAKSQNVAGEEKQQAERLTHNAVVVYQVKCNDVELFQSSDVRAVWSHVFEAVRGKRLSHNLPALCYPATSVSCDNKYDYGTSFNQLGLKHRAVQFLLEQLPGVKKAANKNQFKFQDSTNRGLEEELLPENLTGCARTEGYTGRKPFDMFGWLASKQRKPLAMPLQNKSSDLAKSADLPMAMKFRNLGKNGLKHLQVFWSVIHGRGLFTTKDIEDGEMIIEYAGEIIRPSLCDSREKYYDSKGIGCYMFKIDDSTVVDATMKGNSARFINHSCDPNCRSKITEIVGKKRILIFALRKIQYGEELTYDYKFPYEEVKIPCKCGAAKCKKYLN